MKYRKDRYGNDLSILGYGCMRFPQKLGRIDMEATERQILRAYRGGVNYYDTAYIYPGSEAALGEILEKNNIRDKVNIATKLPHYLIRNEEGLEKTFQEELRRLRTDHIDYYLMHMLTDVATWERLKNLGITDWLERKKKEGAIRQVGFSYHGNADMFCQLIDEYDWDFCQIQYNYMDEHSQAGVKGLHYANKKGIPVVIMEPLRGGKLVKLLPKKALETFEKYPVKRTPAEWAFRWLWNQPEVTVVLSGMNTDEMVEENVRTASVAEAGEFSAEDRRLLHYITTLLNAKMKVGCTGCGYCMPCPSGVDIPGTFAAYNRSSTEGRMNGWIDYFMCTALRSKSTAASNCIECGRCEKHCPQHIQIRQELKNARKVLEGPVYTIGRKAVRFVRRY